MFLSLSIIIISVSYCCNCSDDDNNQQNNQKKDMGPTLGGDMLTIMDTPEPSF